jgi:SAM-dependent methyltransferase/chorismate mutase
MKGVEMEKLLNLQELGRRLAFLDEMIWALAGNRVHLARQVEAYKHQTGEPIFRREAEESRITAASTWASARNLNPHFYEGLEYALIGESCKEQIIQREGRLDSGEVENEDEWYKRLKKNLLILTERWHMDYDISYENYFATKTYLAHEYKLIAQEIGRLSDTEVMIDLGCATGRTTFTFYKAFDRAVGYDISQHMQTRANGLAMEQNMDSKVSFECVDLENGIPMQDDSVSFVVMNLGTASDVRDIDKVVRETFRVLKHGGRFFFSFYNRDALIYRSEFIPWDTGLAASINIHRDSLDVHSINKEGKEEIIPVYARAYTMGEVASLFEKQGVSVDLSTHPAISALLPKELFSSQPDVQKAIIAIDSTLTNTTLGAYIIATGEKTR